MKYIPVINKEKTGENIKKLRKKHRLSAPALAEKVGLEHVQSVYKWESGVNIPTVDNLIILGTIFGVLIEDIVHVDMVKI